MVAPVTGPFTTYPVSPFADSMQKKYRQAPPYDLSLAYEMYYTYGRAVRTTMSGGTVILKQTDFDLYSHADAGRKFTHCTNLAYERLRSQLGPTAGWAENLAQINKTRTSVIERAVQLGDFAKALRKGRFKEAARVLRTPVPSGVSNRKAVSQNFLEYEYGWKPIVSDLVNSLERLNSFPDVHVPLRSTARDSINSVTVNRSNGAGFSSTVTTAINGRVEVRMGALARIVNPNLFLANQLGVIDLALPWKLIPFSFVVDWFTNVEQVISSITDWYGVQLLHPYTNRFAQGQKTVTTRSFWWSTATGIVYESQIIDLDQDSVHLLRTQAISGPVLAMKPFKGFSLQRGAQAISLVLSVLGK